MHIVERTIVFDGAGRTTHFETIDGKVIPSSLPIDYTRRNRKDRSGTVARIHE